MWVPGGVVLMVFALALFAAWIGECARRHEGATSFELQWPPQLPCSRTPNGRRAALLHLAEVKSCLRGRVPSGESDKRRR